MVKWIASDIALLVSVGGHNMDDRKCCGEERGIVLCATLCVHCAWCVRVHMCTRAVQQYILCGDLYAREFLMISFCTSAYMYTLYFHVLPGAVTAAEAMRNVWL
jgi:hypothetical protein